MANVNINGNKIINMVSTSNKEVNLISGIRFIVRFEDYDGTLLEEQSIVEGGDASPPIVPERTGYNFIG